MSGLSRMPVVQGPQSSFFQAEKPMLFFEDEQETDGVRRGLDEEKNLAGIALSATHAPTPATIKITKPPVA
ncbi:hypothetical protein N7451_004201 [Penicillium sp. IBT 35674x]|nr:hypothetical protein N7451_004201 [Penicillium sp. IBT 35674x]